jgi:hypothetical protein
MGFQVPESTRVVLGCHQDRTHIRWGLSKPTIQWWGLRLSLEGSGETGSMSMRNQRWPPSRWVQASHAWTQVPTIFALTRFFGSILLINSLCQVFNADGAPHHYKTHKSVKLRTHKNHILSINFFILRAWSFVIQNQIFKNSVNNNLG